MAFKVGDRVVVASHGVGQIVRLEQKRFAGVEQRLYYEVSTPTSTIWVPVDGGPGVRLRAVTPRNELNRYRAVLRGQPAELNKDRRQRQMDVTQRLKEGSFQALCEVARDLNASGWRKPLNETDASLLKTALDNVSREWAASENVDVAEATREISALLQEARQAHQL
jgi:RNA polymerase-interacting CarD/CdnL/TRCF family regulator